MGEPARKPRAGERAATSWPRLRPAITHDNRFFWEGLSEGKLLLQRCSGCRKLRHPPGPMCSACQSLAWETQQASGRGVLYSWVVAHHPPVPPFEYPHPVALVELDEGVRIVATLDGVVRDEIQIGMALRCEIVEVDDGFYLPRFRPAAE
jgi:uncharacterized OB-fold protein